MKQRDAEIQNKESEIRASVEEKTTGEIQRIREAADRESMRKLAEIKQYSDSMTVSLEKLFEQNRVLWESDIVNQVIGK